VSEIPIEPPSDLDDERRLWREHVGRFALVEIDEFSPRLWIGWNCQLARGESPSSRHFAVVHPNTKPGRVVSKWDNRPTPFFVQLEHVMDTGGRRWLMDDEVRQRAEALAVAIGDPSSRSQDVRLDERDKWGSIRIDRCWLAVVVYRAILWGGAVDCDSLRASLNERRQLAEKHGIRDRRESPEGGEKTFGCKHKLVYPGLTSRSPS
jgi:hypothetical protein